MALQKSLVTSYNVNASYWKITNLNIEQKNLIINDYNAFIDNFYSKRTELFLNLDVEP